MLLHSLAFTKNLGSLAKHLHSLTKPLLYIYPINFSFTHKNAKLCHETLDGAG